MNIRSRSQRPYLLLEAALFVLFLVLLVAHYLAPLSGGQTEFAWWTAPLLGVPFLLALTVHSFRPRDDATRLRKRRWHDPRLPSSQER